LGLYGGAADGGGCRVKWIYFDAAGLLIGTVHLLLLAARGPLFEGPFGWIWWTRGPGLAGALILTCGLGLWREVRRRRPAAKGDPAGEGGDPR